MSIIMDFISQVPLLLIISLSLITTTTRADPLYQICQNNGNYTTNNTYQSNLNTLLRSLSSNGPITGFFTATQGSPPDQVDGLVLCRGDTNETTCAACLDNAVPDITQLCPYQKSAIIWYDDCLLRYSNLRFFNSSDESHDFYMWNVKNVSDPTPFFKMLNGLMDSLVNQAVNDTSSEMFATRDVKANGAQRLYGLVQCTRDLSGDSCANCLRDAIGEIPTCCAGKIGGRVIGASCNIRYEVYRFYGNSSIRTASGGSPPPLPPPPTTTMITQRRRKKNKLRIALLIIIPVFLFLVIVSVAFACLRKKMIIMKNVQSHQEVHQITDIEPLVFDLAMLRIATNDFSDTNKLGEGGFGMVYKGTLAYGQEIAVKRLSKTSGQGLQELRNEVMLVTRLQHRNLVRLLGCCLEEQERLLVYEFVPNNSLDKFLFDPVNIRQLTWERRYKIIEGIARGLLYLHEDSQLRIIHRDLKVSNILLDKDMNPKISDFGLAKLFEMDQTQGNTSRVVGTYGYMAPEYAMRGHFSIKSDVFSFGVLVLEIMTGWRSNQF